MSGLPAALNTFANRSGVVKRASAKAGFRYRQVRRIWTESGGHGVLDRVRRLVADRLEPSTLPLPVRPTDVLACDLTSSPSWSWLPVHGDERLIVNWITTPPARGSGGHTTTFRLIQHFERRGHLSRIYLYDVYDGDAAYYAAQVRELFPWYAGEIYDVCNGMADAHSVVATSWQTAYPAYGDPCLGKRFYLVQDFEPWFYPMGGLNALAENTYRMGFHAITAGRFLAAKLKTEYGMNAEAFDFGSDAERYHLLKSESVRDGITFYARPQTPRRGFEQGIMALQLFAKRHPEITIHLYGDRIGKLPFPFIDHGVLSPDVLNRIYNRCFAGLSLSMTNVSLVPYEMLSAGCIPVVNEAEHNRVVLDNPFVRYATPTPHALASALEEVVRTKDFCALAVSASSSVSSASWEAAGHAVERTMWCALQG
jgi:hypothetical protein